MNRDKKDTSGKIKNWHVVIVIVVLCGIISWIWHIWPSLVSQSVGVLSECQKESYETFGQYGDMFGALNALFTGLAFVLFLATLLLQSKELRLQRNELREAREAQKAQAKNLELQYFQLRNQTSASAYVAAYEILQKEARDWRDKAFQGAETLDTIPNKESPKSEAYEHLMQSYDAVGIMVEAGSLPRELIVDSWGSSLRRSWLFCKDYLYQLREIRNASELWDGYEGLVLDAYLIHFIGKSSFQKFVDTSPAFPKKMPALEVKAIRDGSIHLGSKFSWRVDSNSALNLVEYVFNYASDSIVLNRWPEDSPIDAWKKDLQRAKNNALSRIREKDSTYIEL